MCVCVCVFAKLHGPTLPGMARHGRTRSDKTVLNVQRVFLFLMLCSEFPMLIFQIMLFYACCLVRVHFF